MVARRWLLLSMGLVCLSQFPSAAAAQTFITAWGSLGSGNGQFENPNCVATDAAGNVYVSDGDNRRIQKFGSAPTPVQSVTWGSMKARYRGAPGAAQSPTQNK